MNLLGKNIVVYDCEIENDVDGKEVTWERKDKMGFSVGCLYDYKTDDYHVFLKEDINHLADRLNSADLVVGFNILGFDNDLVRAQGGDLKPDSELKCYDLLYYSRLSIGWTPDQKFPKGMRLDNHLESMFGKENMKTEDGANAPKMWREGQKSRVISYCLSDVKREKMVFEHVACMGWASTLAYGKRFFDLTPILEAVK